MEPGEDLRLMVLFQRDLLLYSNETDASCPLWTEDGKEYLFILLLLLLLLLFIILSIK